MATENRLVNLDSIIEQVEHEWGYEGMREDLYKLPTVDAVEVVRCKDCQYWDDRRCNGKKNGLVMEYTDEDDFCSYGKRREE